MGSCTGAAMDRKALNGVELAYEIAGSGDPLVLIHAGVCADFFAPLAGEAALAERFRVLRYHRPGYGESPALDGPVSISDHAAHCAALVDELGARAGARGGPLVERDDRAPAGTREA